MGGKAFNSGPEPLSTPRMSVQIYTLVKQNVTSLLSNHFKEVGTPIEALGKTSYGDVDFQVANPISALPEPKIEYLARILGASKWINAKHLTYNFALPYPELPHSSDRAGGDEIEKAEQQILEAPEIDPISAKFVQVDLHICVNFEEFTWNLFHEDHGDLWNILGTTIRKQGITVNNAGIHIRIPEIEEFNRKRALVFLSSDPKQVLEFLGLDKEKWWVGLGSLEEMFEYATTCRFFSVKYHDKKDEAECEKGLEGYLTSLKSNDRKRMKDRPLFKKWIEEYLPKLRAKDLFHVDPIPRTRVTKMAFETFGETPRAEYNTRLAEWQREKDKETVKGIIKETVPMPPGDGAVKGTKEWQHRSAAIRGLNAVLIDGDTDDGVELEDGILKDGFYDMDKVKDFAKRKWKEAGDARWVKIQEQSAEAMRKKRQKAALLEKKEKGEVMGE